MSLPNGIEQWDILEWQNAHKNFKARFSKNASFSLKNPDSLTKSADKYKKTTENFQWLIQHAIDNNIQLRAMGNGWSFTEVAVSGNGVINTKSLRLSFNLKDNYVSDAYRNTGKTAGDLFLAQCGMSILQLHTKLEKERNPRRCLKACGASNGQSIVGAMSTGTHGSAYTVGAIQDSVLGLHIVVGPNRHVWIERASNPVVSDEFINWLEAELVRDDDVFNAALVSFGSFGFIHGVLLETEPTFLLDEFRTDQVAYNDVLKGTINTLDFTSIAPHLPLPVDDAARQLYHFEVLINPHRFEPDNPAKGVFFKTMYKSVYRDDYTRRQTNDNGFMYGDDLLGVVQTLLDSLGSLSTAIVPSLVNTLFPLAFKASEQATGTLGETFINTKFRGKVASAAIGLDCSNASRVVEEIIAVNKQTPFPGGLALRFVKGTQALLGFTRFPKTCILELDGVDSNVSREFFEKVWDRLEELHIPYTLHWGKINFILNPERIRTMYGDAAVNKWIASRNFLLDVASRKVFTNKFMEQCGLA
jgi:hypothetical protein